MLDRIESLMEGVRHVSNSIAHDLRTPLSRACAARLERALQAAADPHALVGDARLAIEEIDNVIGLFDKLLQIAAAETGRAHAHASNTLDLAAIAHDMAELYEAGRGRAGRAAALRRRRRRSPVRGDRDLLASALASLIDNAIKYAAAAASGRRRRRAATAARGRGLGARLRPRRAGERPGASICERFYRVDQSRHLPGNGLGLSSVTAIAQLHGASLALRNAAPGLEASLVFPAP